MHAVDSNILTRYFRADDAKQSALAHRVMTQDRVFIPKTVLLEFEAVMRYVYEHGRSDIEACLSTLLNLPNVLIEERPRLGQHFKHTSTVLTGPMPCIWLRARNAMISSPSMRDDSPAARRLALKPPVTVPA